MIIIFEAILSDCRIGKSSRKDNLKFQPTVLQFYQTIIHCFKPPLIFIVDGCCFGIKLYC